MKITSFNPLIITKDAASVIELFEALGFEKRHTKTGIHGKDIRLWDLKNVTPRQGSMAKTSPQSV